MIGSMGRVGAAGDNASMESFFSLLQKDVLDLRSWAMREELRIAIVTWIERTTGSSRLRRCRAADHLLEVLQRERITHRAADTERSVLEPCEIDAKTPRSWNRPRAR